MSAPFSARQRGFSLVEIMVGLAIGMLAVVIIMQVFSAAEANKRTTTGSSDAMSEGAIALYTLQRDIRQGGYGIAFTGLFECAVTLPPVDAPAVPIAPVTINTNATIVPVGDTNTDTLLVFYGNPAGQPEGHAFEAAPTDATNWYISATECAASGETTMTKTPDTGTLFDLGPSPVVQAFAVRGGNLMVCNYMTSNCGADCEAGNSSCNANWTAVASNIVSLRAQYGREVAVPAGEPTGFVVDTYDQEVPADSCAQAKIAALRLAVVARSAQPANSITSVAPPWDGDEMTPIDLSGNADWQNYRYKAFQTVIPLRNVNWMGRPC